MYFILKQEIWFPILDNSEFLNTLSEVESNMNDLWKKMMTIFETKRAAFRCTQGTITLWMQLDVYFTYPISHLIEPN